MLCSNASRYLYKVYISVFKGPIGIKGDEGEPGPNGLKGEMGYQGNKGDRGM